MLINLCIHYTLHSSLFIPAIIHRAPRTACSEKSSFDPSPQPVICKSSERGTDKLIHCGISMAHVPGGQRWQQLTPLYPQSVINVLIDPNLYAVVSTSDCSKVTVSHRKLLAVTLFTIYNTGMNLL